MQYSQRCMWVMAQWWMVGLHLSIGFFFSCFVCVYSAVFLMLTIFHDQLVRDPCHPAGSELHFHEQTCYLSLIQQCPKIDVFYFSVVIPLCLFQNNNFQVSSSLKAHLLTLPLCFMLYLRAVHCLLGERPTYYLWHLKSWKCCILYLRGVCLKCWDLQTMLKAFAISASFKDFHRISESVLFIM